LEATWAPLSSTPEARSTKEIWKVATTLSNDAQDAATRKARELGFDLKQRTDPLEETLLNLSHNRDILLDAADKTSSCRLPLKLQYNLLAQNSEDSKALTSLVNGTDALLALRTLWTNLCLSVAVQPAISLEEVLGFQSKMNQLKAQETLIRRVHREAKSLKPATRGRTLY